MASQRSSGTVSEKGHGQSMSWGPAGWGGRGPAWCRVGRACEDGALTREGWALRACPAGSAPGAALYPQGPAWWASPVHLHPKQREPTLLRTPTRPLWRIVLPEIMARAPSSLDTLIFSPPFNPHHPPPYAGMIILILLKGPWGSEA